MSSRAEKFDAQADRSNIVPLGLSHVSSLDLPILCLSMVSFVIQNLNKVELGSAGVFQPVPSKRVPIPEKKSSASFPGHMFGAPAKASRLQNVKSNATLPHPRPCKCNSPAPSASWRFIFGEQRMSMGSSGSVHLLHEVSQTNDACFTLLTSMFPVAPPRFWCPSFRGQGALTGIPLDANSGVKPMFPSQPPAQFVQPSWPDPAMLRKLGAQILEVFRS